MDETSLEHLAPQISARLRVERARANLSLREAAAKSGVHYVSISRYEQGKWPPLQALYLLARAYGVDVATFLVPDPGAPVAAPAPRSPDARKRKGK